ncbi:hypothetical protein IMZ38_06715 [Thermosphaera chiliense]|uniref:Uncharacterized protein n=1 Tax=Thermosphaera chiliense TaxID=3402707 RepID=A0A7M1UPY4_9CREN|nr:hypothetical protein [Thermosphaera aggregans]QOR94300.1 hypothetical protein IMZ38_06715 [Thermosphaera aggregans]
MVATEEVIGDWIRGFLREKLGAGGFTEKRIRERDLRGALHYFTIFRVSRGDETILIRLGDGILRINYTGRSINSERKELFEKLGLLVEETDDMFTAYYKGMVEAISIGDLEPILTLVLEGVFNET